MRLRFASYHATENSNQYDRRWVEVSCDGFKTAIVGRQLDNGSNQKTWISESLDLDTMAGKTVALRFRFDSVDNDSNNHAGWFVDDIALEAAEVTATACEVDADCSDGDARTLTLAACKTDADCGEGDGCGTPTCAAGTCKSASPKVDGTACNDGNLGTTTDACNGGVCQGKVKVCDDGKPCTWDACNPTTGNCFAQTASDGTPSGNGGTCGAGNCVSTPAP